MASDRKGNLLIPENMGFLAPKRNFFSDSNWHLNRKDDYFTVSGKTFPVPEIVVNLGLIAGDICRNYLRCPWCNGYRRRKWTRRHEFKSWTRLIAFHIALIPLGKVWIQLFSLQLWVNSRTDWSSALVRQLV